MKIEDQIVSEIKSLLRQRSAEIDSPVLSEVPKPSGSLWWPDLFLRKGRNLLQVTPERASVLMGAKREAEALRSGRGSSAVRDIPLHDIDGKRIGRVSFNGRVWLHDIDGDKEIPLQGVKTAEQHESEGWKDCLCAS